MPFAVPSRLRLVPLRSWIAVAALWLAACGDDRGMASSVGLSVGDASGAGSTTAGNTTPGSTASTGGGASTSGGPLFDVGASGGATDGGANMCYVDPDGDAAGPCGEKAPADSFDPQVQWAWEGDGDRKQSLVIPLVANLTDDDGDGVITLCDSPDILVQVFWDYSSYNHDGYLYVLDGATGAVHTSFATAMRKHTTPAIGDIDGDGQPEIVGLTVDRKLVAFDPDGTELWRSVAEVDPAIGGYGAIALANLDGEGTPEILLGNQIFDAGGVLLTTLPDVLPHSGWGNATTAADIDGDGAMEVVLGRSAYRMDGTEVYRVDNVSPGYPQVADLDGDGQPEILVLNEQGISLIRPDGSVTYANSRPTGAGASLENWMRPATIHDFDGDDQAEFATASQGIFAVYESSGQVVWQATVQDITGASAGTAFDFLGDGSANAIYGDERNFHAYDENGAELLTVPRSSGTIIEYPVVADVDNDGSAEVVVVSNEGWFKDQTAPLLQVIRDAQDRWVPARRIWNQHTYHVTNVREDATIPAQEPRHWELLNTFRTQAQIDAGGTCKPPPQG